jgi:anti-sigma factor RsiW
MNQSRFIELLNLYIDDQITADEAAELENAVASDPERQRTYAAYCRMHRACSLIGQHERLHAPASLAFERALRDADRKIAAASRAPRFHPMWGVGLAGVAAMAACIAFVVTRSPQVTAPDAAPVTVAGMSAPTMTVRLRPMPVVALDNADRIEARPVFAHQAYALAVHDNQETADADTVDRAVAAWAQRVQLDSRKPVLAEDMAFETRSTIHPDNRVFRSRRPMQATAEFTAYQFQR